MNLSPLVIIRVFKSGRGKQKREGQRDGSMEGLGPTIAGGKEPLAKECCRL